MSTPSHDDTGRAAATQGGGRDDGPGPSRVQGRSIWWIGAVVVVAGVVALFLVFGHERRAPAETGTTPVAGAAGASRPATP